MADIVYINEEEGKKRVMNNNKLYAKLLAKFKADKTIDELTSYAESQDWEKAQIAVHTIKGVAANLSLTELFNQSLTVENQIKGRSLRSESLDKYKTCFTETMLAADKVIAENA